MGGVERLEIVLGFCRVFREDRLQRGAFLMGDLARICAPPALELQVLANGVV